MKKFSKTLRVVTAVFLLCAMNSSYAWYHGGHMLVAQIAYDNLTDSTKKRMDQLVGLYAPYYPDLNSFMRSATWPDVIKGHDVQAFNTWHYIDIPFSDDGTALPQVSHENVVWALGQSRKVVGSYKANDFEKAMFLRFLTHFTGDAHQPLHAVSRYSSKYPKGDKGGNLFQIRSGRAKNLHQLWDSAFGVIPENKAVGEMGIKTIAQKLEQKYPRASLERSITIQEPSRWVEEDFKIAQKFAYNIKPGEKPSVGYKQKGRALCEQRLVLAGYRLAYWLNTHI